MSIFCQYICRQIIVLIFAIEKKQISKGSRKKLEEPFTEKEIRTAIRGMARGKAPGPGLGILVHEWSPPKGSPLQAPQGPRGPRGPKGPGGSRGP